MTGRQNKLPCPQIPQAFQNRLRTFSEVVSMGVGLVIAVELTGKPLHGLYGKIKQMLVELADRRAHIRIVLLHGDAASAAAGKHIVHRIQREANVIAESAVPIPKYVHKAPFSTLDTKKG
jgi:hypothetical protein